MEHDLVSVEDNSIFERLCICKNCGIQTNVVYFEFIECKEDGYVRT